VMGGREKKRGDFAMFSGRRERERRCCSSNSQPWLNHPLLPKRRAGDGTGDEEEKKVPAQREREKGGERYLSSKTGFRAKSNPSVRKREVISHI